MLSKGLVIERKFRDSKSPGGRQTSQVRYKVLKEDSTELFIRE
jgi:hypothetical protein